MENFLCVLAIHNNILEAWKHKLLKTGLKVEVLENDTITISI